MCTHSQSLFAATSTMVDLLFSRALALGGFVPALPTQLSKRISFFLGLNQSPGLRGGLSDSRPRRDWTVCPLHIVYGCDNLYSFNLPVESLQAASAAELPRAKYECKTICWPCDEVWYLLTRCPLLAIVCPLCLTHQNCHCPRISSTRCNTCRQKELVVCQSRLDLVYLSKTLQHYFMKLFLDQVDR